MQLDRLRELGALVERVQRVLEIRHPHAERIQFVLEGIDELLKLVEVGFRGISGAVGLQLRDDAGDDHRHLETRQLTVALEFAVRISLDQTVRGQRLDCLIGPVIRRHVGKWGSRDALTQRQERAYSKARCEDEGSETLHRVLREKCDVLPRSVAPTSRRTIGFRCCPKPYRRKCPSRSQPRRARRGRVRNGTHANVAIPKRPLGLLPCSY